MRLSGNKTISAVGMQEASDLAGSTKNPTINAYYFSGKGARNPAGRAMLGIQLHAPGKKQATTQPSAWRSYRLRLRASGHGCEQLMLADMLPFDARVFAHWANQFNGVGAIAVPQPAIAFHGEVQACQHD